MSEGPTPPTREEVETIIAKLRDLAKGEADYERAGLSCPVQTSAIDVDELCQKAAAALESLLSRDQGGEGRPEPAGEKSELVERFAQAIFETRAFGAPVAWVERGNSIKQEDCRDMARACLAALGKCPPPAPERKDDTPGSDVLLSARRKKD